MVITSDGNFARGEDAADLAGWLREYEADGYPVDRVVASACRKCGHGFFRVVTDDGGVAAYRRCAGCGHVVYIADSEQNWMDEEAGPVSCDCGGDTFEVAVSFSLYAGGENVRRVCVGVRCTADGALGSPASWTVREHPSLHLIDQA